MIWGQRLAADGLSVTGSAGRALVEDDQTWEWKLVEAPTMVRSPAGYQLFFSAAFYGWDPNERLSPYAIGYATCAGPLGPCTDAPENPILHSFNDSAAGCLSGPGHPSIFEARGRHFIAFHAWAASRACRKADDKRYLYVAPLFWKDGKPQIGAEPAPAEQPGVDLRSLRLGLPPCLASLLRRPPPPAGGALTATAPARSRAGSARRTRPAPRAPARARIAAPRAMPSTPSRSAARTSSPTSRAPARSTGCG